MQNFRIALLAGLIAAATCGQAQAQANASPIKVGTIVSVSGPLAHIGATKREAYQLAEKTINQRGGVGGRPLQLIFEDDASNPDTAVTKVNALLNSGVVAILGPTGLAATVATGGITAQKGALQITGAGIGLPAERERKCLLHMMPSQQINAAGLLSYAADGVKAKRVAVLYDSGFGQAVMNSIKEIQGKYGVSFIAAEKFDLAATDMSSQAAKIRAANPDLIFVISASATPFRNLRQLKVSAPMVTPLAAAVYDTIKAMGEAAEGTVFVDYVVPEEPRAREKEFVDLFQKAYGKLPKNYEAAAWEAVMVLTEALKKAGPDAGGEKLCAAARGKHVGAHIDYDFSAPDMTGIGVSSFQYSTVKDGKFTRLPFHARER
ncbi:MAG: ABC transporter substrate-binding protein [Lautropia sp.]